jgi:hemoglobin
MQSPLCSRVGRVIAGLILFTIATLSDAGPSLYDRLGGGDGVNAIVNELIDRSRTGPDTSRSFEKVNLKRLKQQIAVQLCSLSGGPCAFTGDDMKTTHAGHDITQAEFYAMVEILRAVLDDRGVGEREKNELLALLAPFKRDVVTR